MVWKITATRYKISYKRGPLMTLPRMKIGTGLGFTRDYSTQVPTVDLMKISRRWFGTYQSHLGGHPNNTTVQVDENGWPMPDLNADPPQRASTLIHRDIGQSFDEGEYVIEWEGDGQVLALADARNTTKVEPNCIEFVIDFNELPILNGIHIQVVTSNPSNPIRNITVHKKELRKFGNQWQPGLTNELRHMDTIRFLNPHMISTSEIVEWEDNLSENYATWTTEKGWPVSRMVDLCYQSKSNGWFHIPAKASDDYIERMAEFLLTSMPENSEIYVEYANEIGWNSIFPHTQWAQEQGLALGLDTVAYPAGIKFVAKRSIEIANIFRRVFSRTLFCGRFNSYPFVHVLGTWTGQPNYTISLLEYPGLVEAIDAIAVTMYMGGQAHDPIVAIGEDVSLEQMVVEYQKAIDENLEDLVKSQVDTIRSFSQRLRVLCYEAGNGLVVKQRGGSDAWLAEKIVELTRSDYMSEFVAQMLSIWNKHSGDLLCFLADSHYPDWQTSWGLREDQRVSYENTVQGKVVLNAINGLLEDRLIQSSEC